MAKDSVQPRKKATAPRGPRTGKAGKASTRAPGGPRSRLQRSKPKAAAPKKKAAPRRKAAKLHKPAPKRAPRGPKPPDRAFRFESVAHVHATQNAGMLGFRPI